MEPPVLGLGAILAKKNLYNFMGLESQRFRRYETAGKNCIPYNALYIRLYREIVKFWIF